MFVNRRKELEILKNAIRAFEIGRKIPIAIIGLRRIGKTEIIRKFREKKQNILMPYLNLQGSVSSPKSFCQDFYLALLEEIARDKEISFVPLGEKKGQIMNLATLLGENIQNISLRFLDSLEEGDYSSMIQSALKIPEIISGIYRRKIVFFLDEFQELESLNNYRFGDVFKIMRSVVEKQTKTIYVISGSIISFMEELVKGSREPFFNQFSELRLSYFTKEDSITLIKRLLEGYDYPNEILYYLFRNSSGHPFYITSICERLIIESLNYSVDLFTLKYCIIKEVLDKNGKINLLFRYIFEESLRKTKRQGNIKSILLILAEKEGLNLTALSGRLRKPAGQVNNYLKSLLKTDLIFGVDKRYFFRDKLFRFWVAKTQLGKDVEIEKNKRFIQDLLDELKEKYLMVSTELGKAKEYEWKVKLEEEFGIKLENYNKEVEFDLVGRKLDVWYIFEIKHRNKLTNYEDINEFLKKVRRSEFEDKKKRLFFISKLGFTERAKKLIEKNKIEIK